MREVPERNLCCLLKIRVLKNLFPNCRSVILKEHDTVNSTTNLSTWRHWPIRAWYQNLVSRNGCIKGISPGSATLSPSPGYHSAHFARRYFSYLTTFVAFSPTAEPCPRLISHKIALVSSVMEHSMHELFCCLAHDCNYCDEKLGDINFKSGLYRPCHGFWCHLDE